MNIPVLLNIVPGVVAFFVSLFVFWSESKKDGFNETKAFDLFLLCIGLIVGGNFYTEFKYLGFILAFALIWFFSRKWRWSIYRKLDIISLSCLLGFSIYILGKFLVTSNFAFLIYGITGILMFGFMSNFRNNVLKSGVSFVIIVFYSVSVSIVYDRALLSLIFYISMVTLSLISLYFRFKGNMENKKLSSGILNFLKNKLTFKQKELASEQKILNEEDPFLREGREQDGSENLDTVILNDVRKEEIDARKGNISKMQISVKKALAMMNLGTYGKCEVCGAPIDVARLKAYPEATTCLKHAKN